MRKIERRVDGFVFSVELRQGTRPWLTCGDPEWSTLADAMGCASFPDFVGSVGDRSGVHPEGMGGFSYNNDGEDADTVDAHFQGEDRTYGQDFFDRAALEYMTAGFELLREAGNPPEPWMEKCLANVKARVAARK